MRKTRNITGQPDEVEQAFYEALQAGDLEALMACWADDDDIVCVHPGGGRLQGAAAIRAVFEAMFSHGGGVRARPERLQKIACGTSWVHSVVERVSIATDDGEKTAYVIATNVYTQTAKGWRMVVHHASPGTAQDPLPAAAAVVLH
jgi:ketosteroid isomerase-like protein